MRSGTIIEYIGGPLDGRKSEFFKLPSPCVERMHMGVLFIYRLLDYDGELAYVVEGFHGQLINDVKEERAE